VEIGLAQESATTSWNQEVYWSKNSQKWNLFFVCTPSLSPTPRDSDQKSVLPDFVGCSQAES
jgi:hypothetical protein